MEVTIEPASIALLDELYEIEKQCFQEEAFSKLQIGYLLAAGASVSLAARAEGRLVGFIIGLVEWVHSQPVGHVVTLEVLPFFRRRGIAQRLMLEAEAVFKQSGAGEARLEVRESNTAALGLYVKLGYRKAALLEGYYGKVNGLYLRKALL
jgi:ribosomal-protein-alanine N-acetyltransferase